MPRTLRLLTLAMFCALSALIPAAASAATAHATRSAAAKPATAPAALSLILPLAANDAGLERYAMAVSTPGNKLYRRYKSIAWLANRFGASKAGERRVVAYLTAHGATRVGVDATGLSIHATLSTRAAERLFETGERVHASRAGAYVTPEQAVTIPAALRGVVTGVIGLDTEPLASSTVARSPASEQSSNDFRSLSASSIGASYDDPPNNSYYEKVAPVTTSDGTESGCASGEATGGFTPNQYEDAYGDSALQAQGLEGQGIRVAVIETDGYKSADIRAFDSCFGLPNENIKAFRTSNAVSAGGEAPGPETTLDLEVLSATAPDLKQIDVYETTDDTASVLSSITAPLENLGYKPQVISVSLGLCETGTRENIGLSGMKEAQATFADAAASGISVLVAAGDSGSSDCADPYSEQGYPYPVLAVDFPAGSSYVTAVGGTNFVLNSSNQIVAQDVWNDTDNFVGAAGGGGFSSVFARPSYQNGFNNEAHRAVPDVSGLADTTPGYDIYCSVASGDEPCIGPSDPSPWIFIGGTSAAAPLLAGGVALIDQELAAHKQQPLGLINPLLYKLASDPTDDAEVFSDVTTGSNDVGPYIRASGQPLGCCSATAGYDEASGLGSVNVANFSTFALQSSPAIVNISEAVSPNTTAIANGYISTTVTGSGRAQIGAYAQISYAGGKTDVVYSGLYHLTAAGSELIKIPIPGAELRKLRAAKARGRRINAIVYGAIVDAGENITSHTPGQTVTLNP